VSQYVYDSLVDHVASGKLAKCNRDGLKLLRPLIAARRDEKNEQDENSVRRLLSVSLKNSPSSEQNDYLTWLIHQFKGEDGEDSAIASRMLGLNFVAIQTSSMVSFPNHQVDTNLSPVQAVTQALFDLALHPEYLEPLREEVEEVTKREGWTKTALDQMFKLWRSVKDDMRVPVDFLLRQKSRSCLLTL